MKWSNQVVKSSGQIKWSNQVVKLKWSNQVVKLKWSNQWSNQSGASHGVSERGGVGVVVEEQVEVLDLPPHLARQRIKATWSRPSAHLSYQTCPSAYQSHATSLTSLRLP